MRHAGWTSGASLIVTPDLLFLDEPTTGMDPRSQSQVCQELVRQDRRGNGYHEVLLTTPGTWRKPIKLAEQIAVIDHGRIVAEGTSAQLQGPGRLGDLARPASRWPAAIPGPGGPAYRRPCRGPVHLGADPLTLSVPLATPADPADTGRLVGHAMTRLLRGPGGGRRSHSRPASACTRRSSPSRATPPAQPQPNTGTRIHEHPRPPPPAAPCRRARRLDGLLAPSVPPLRRAGALAASATFRWRAMLKIKHEPKQLTDVIAIPVLITRPVHLYLFGGTISGSPGSYLNILLPGTLVMGIVLVTMYGGARLAQDVTTGVFDRYRSLSVWRGAFVLGGLLSDVGRYLTFASAIVVILGLIMGYRPDGGAPGVLAAVALVVAFGLSLSWLWAAVALLVRDPAVVISIANVVLMPLSFASNVFVQPRTMPGWLQALPVNVNPVTHLATAA